MSDKFADGIRQIIDKGINEVVDIWRDRVKELQAELDKPITEHPDVQRLVGQVTELQAEKEAIKTQYAKDLVAINQFYFSKPVCKNQPPEITNGYNSCLSCPMRKTCLLVFEAN